MPAFDEQDYTKSFQWGTWKRLMPVMRPYRRDFAGMFAFNLITAAIDVVLPLFQRYAISNYIEAGTLSGLLPYTLCYFGVILLQALSVVAFARNSMKIEMCAGRDMRANLFTHLQTLSFSFYNVTPVGYLLSRVMSDTSRIASMVAWNLTDILWAMFYVLGTFAAMLLLNWKLALVVIVIVPVIAVLTGYFQNRILHWNRRVRKLNSRITGAFNEGITGAKTSKTLGIEEQNTASFRALTKEMHDCGIRAARLNAVYIPLVLFCSTAAVAIVLLRGGYMVQEQVLQIATLSAFTTYAVGIFEPIQMTAANIAEFISLQASIERVTGLLDEKPQIADTPEVIARYGDAFHPKRENWEPLRGDIEFRDVTFRYPDGGEDVLSHFSLKIPAGTTVAIVGETGAGKSTLVNLACRFFEPTSGQILIDGRDYRERSQLWHDPREHPLRPSGCHGRRGRGSGADRFGQSGRSQARKGLGQRRRRGRRPPVHGRKAADLLCARRAGRSAHLRARRGDVLHRHADGAAYPERHRPPAARPHVVPDRPPPVHHPQGGPHPRRARRPHRRAGQAPGAAAEGRLLPRPLYPPVCRGKRRKDFEVRQ